MNNLKPGTRMLSPVSMTEVIVIKPPLGDVDLWCASRPMSLMGPPEPTITSDDAVKPHGADAVLLGKRYRHEGSGLEVLCTKPGEGPLTVNGERLEIKAPKPLPTSD
jgi:hypothetical protein